MNCINWGFVKRHNLPQHCLPKPIYARNVDGSYNEAGLIKFITTIFIRINGIIHRVLFHIINCGNKNIILGDPWLRKINPLVNWEKRTLEIPEHTDKTHDFNCQNSRNKSRQSPPANLLPHDFIREKPSYPDENFINFIKGIKGEKCYPIPKFRKTNRKFTPVPISKVSIATELARDVIAEEITLQGRYQEFSSVFN